MKSIVFRLVLALAAFTIVPNAWAAPGDSGNFFVGAKLAEEFGKPVSDGGYSTNSAVALGADGGYLWNLDASRSLGLEVGYVYFGNVADSGVYNIGGISATAMTAGGRFHILFGDGDAWIVQARAGLMQLQVDGSFSDSENQSGTYLGLGIGRIITPHLSVILAYDRYSSIRTSGESEPALDLNLIGLQAEYRF